MLKLQLHSVSKMAASMDSTFAFIEFVCVFLGLSASLLIKIDQRQPEPYMDEIFHIPQAQRYCEGRFTQWDPMITTLPGLYMVTVGSYRPLSWLFGFPIDGACSVFWLRVVNVVLAAGNVILIHLLIKAIHKHHQDYTPLRCVLKTAALSIFPVLYFFTFLYYTDPGSTFCVLLMYLLSLYDNHLTSAGVGVVAVLFRQTNIVWVVFTAGMVTSRRIVDYIQPSKKDISMERLQGFKLIWIILDQFLRDMKSTTALARVFWIGLIQTVLPYAGVCLGFIVFVILNGGIVVGAKDDHSVSMNFPQLFYFSAFTGVFSCMHLATLYKLRDFFRFLYNRPIFAIVFTIIAGLLIWKFTYEHRYLLADNRHYTFYIWQRIFQRHEYVKYALIPGYLYAWWAIFNNLSHQNFLWKLVYFVCVFVNLVPQMLLEFRYFIIPYLVFRLHCKFSKYVQIVLEIFLYLLVNVATVYLFLEKPFKWPNDSAAQRFIW